MAGWSEGGWWNGRRREVAGKSAWQGGMEEAPENGKQSPHSVHANGLIDWLRLRACNFCWLNILLLLHVNCSYGYKQLYLTIDQILRCEVPTTVSKITAVFSDMMQCSLTNGNHISEQHLPCRRRQQVPPNAGTHLPNRWCFIQQHHKSTKSISYATEEPEQRTQCSSHFIGWTTGYSMFDSMLGKSCLFSTALWPTLRFT